MPPTVYWLITAVNRDNFEGAKNSIINGCQIYIYEISKLEILFVFGIMPTCELRVNMIEI